MSDSLIGEKLGQYEIRMLLGKGGMSTVYLAYQPSMDRVVAVKVLPREFLHDDQFLHRFRREVRTIAGLEHLHILPVYDVGEDQGLPYYVMRYLAGGTLADLIDSRLPDMRTVLRIAGQVAGALDYAHERGIIHRDIKPSNVLLDGSGNAYLADFGIARIQESASVTTGSHVMGTPDYVAPEMVRKGETITPSVDIYALGALVYEMLTGDPPYVAADTAGVMMAHVMAPIPSVRDFDPNFSPALDDALKRCLAKQPADRYGTASEFVREMVRADQGGSPTLNAPIVLPDDGQPPAAPADPWRRAPAAAAGPGDRLPRRPPVPGRAPRRAADEDLDARRGGSGLGGCLIALGVILALLGGMIAAAFILTDGTPFSLLAVLTPLPTRPATPTVTPLAVTATAAAEAAAGPTVTPLLPTPAAGGRLAFASNRDGDYEIYLIEVDGENLQQLTDNRYLDFDPIWSPDGNQIVYVATEGGDAELRIMDADGGNVRQITDNTARDADPDWSPDGEWIAFASDRDGDSEIYLIRPDGTDLRRLTDNDVEDLSPAWSPDGSQIAYHSRPDDDAASTELYVIPAGGGEPTRLTRNSSFDQWPSWSPDGAHLAYTSADGIEGGWRTLFTLDVADGEISRLVDAVGRDDDPAWSPDGTQIAFDGDREGDGLFDIYILDLDTLEVRQITFVDANDVAPAWQP